MLSGDMLIHSRDALTLGQKTGCGNVLTHSGRIWCGQTCADLPLLRTLL